MAQIMFDDKFFDDWLETQAQKVMEQVAGGHSQPHSPLVE